MMTEDPALFGKLRVYKHSSEFPEEAADYIPSPLWQAIDDGNGRFFENLTALPNFHEALLNHCTPVRLLESFADSVDEADSDLRTYHWGSQCEGGLVFIGIPVSVSKTMDEMNADHLSCLPEELKHVYKRMDGMAIQEGYVSQPFDLPRALHSWRNLHAFCDNRMIPFDLSSLPRYLTNADLRVFVCGSRKDLILLNFEDKPSPFYWVRDFDFASLRAIEEPASRLDQYFANALKGFPNKVML